MRRFLVALSLALVVPVSAGCHRNTTSTKSDDAPTPIVSASAPVDGWKAARSLALSPDVGSGTTAQPIDALLTAHREAAQKNDAPADWIALGRLWVRKARETADPGFLLNADAAIDLALDKSPTDRSALDLRAIVLDAEGRYEDARVLARKLADQDDKDARAFGTLGDILLDLGRLEQAAGVIDHMVDLHADLSSWSRQARVRWLQGKPDEAIALARRAIDEGRKAVDPEPVARIAVDAAGFRWARGNLVAASALYAEALTLQPKFPPALVGQARIALARGDGKAAVALAESAFAASPLTITAWLLGDARTFVGDLEGAKQAYADVVRLGRLSDARTLSLFWSTRAEEPAEALKLADAERNVRGDLETIDAYAWALYRNRRFVEAKVQIDSALRFGVREPRSSFHRAAIELALGDDSAKKHLIEALALNPKFDLTSAAEAKRLLDGNPGPASSNALP